MCLNLEHLTTSTTDRKIKKNCQIFQYLYPDSTANVLGGLDDNICLSCKKSKNTANIPSGRESEMSHYLSCRVSSFNKCYLKLPHAVH